MHHLDLLVVIGVVWTETQSSVFWIDWRIDRGIKCRILDSNTYHSSPKRSKWNVYVRYVFSTCWETRCFETVLFIGLEISLLQYQNQKAPTVCDTYGMWIYSTCNKKSNTSSTKYSFSNQTEACALCIFSRKRLLYRRKTENDTLEVEIFLSVLINGDDQSAFGLPHFSMKPKQKWFHARLH